MKHSIFRRPPGRRGSVLVPLLAAILILSLSGIVLSQTFSSQRVQSVLALEGARAFWIAEAGSWHASTAEIEIDTAIKFDIGSYGMEKDTESADGLVAVGRLGDATRRSPIVGALSTDSNTGEGQVSIEPIDEDSTGASAARSSSSRFEISLYSARDYPSVLETISFAASDSSLAIEWIQTDSSDLWYDSSWFGGGEVYIDLSDEDLDLRIVRPDAPRELLIWLTPRPGGKDTIQLLLTFTDGTSSQLEFPIQW